MAFSATPSQQNGSYRPDKPLFDQRPIKLHRKGLKTVCVPMSVENDVAVTLLSFGFKSALSFTVETIERAKLAEAINKVRTVPQGSVFVQVARSLGIALGD